MDIITDILARLIVALIAIAVYTAIFKAVKHIAKGTTREVMDEKKAETEFYKTAAEIEHQLNEKKP